ncbi:Transposase and inactivated derivatives [Leminorella richardii]|uniref:Transposase and inactivated derivatives n=1 Tax=Leminorella richardii TaxID=158841 RepID=A0A2X4XTJ4_9GAMM|nr:helix-turn-helix domain-containing protein [Leminorella richardii]SQI40044.1 Transposase and inactivated derivatives [Leminorella richardii]
MIKTLPPKCPFCDKREQVKKHGSGSAGLQRYRCLDCHKTFQSHYYYRANSPFIDEQIARLSKEGWSAKQIGDYLRVSLPTVNKRLHKLQGKEHQNEPA